MRKFGLFAAMVALGLLVAPSAFADMQVKMYLLKDGPIKNPDKDSHITMLPGKPIGTLMVKQTKDGVLITPDLSDLPPGIHGFHVHEYASCDDFGKAAGGHLDPNHTKHHLGPYNDRGHMGDLPVLFVDDKGRSTTPILATRLELSDLQGHSFMIHSGGDNYQDEPVALGGGGERIACGVASFILCE